MAKQITKGDFVKIIRGGERFWVEVTSVNGSKVTGRVDSKLVLKHPFKFGDKISFGKSSVIDVMANPASRFEKCVESVEERGDAYDPKAVCAAEGRKKYGKRKFAAMAKAGRERNGRGALLPAKIRILKNGSVQVFASPSVKRRIKSR